MKYLFINSVAGFGSTGRLAAEKCRELMAQGHQCLLAYGRHSENIAGVPTLAIGSPSSVRIHGLRTRLLDDHGFGSRAATVRFLEQVKQYDPDVIWLHNIHGYYLHIGLLFAYLRSCGKPIYWTLHDCWSFTGHCSYFSYAGCDRWKTGCHHCPEKRAYPASLLADRSRKNYLEKRRLFTGIPDLHLITPSAWLADLVKESFLGEYPVEVIHNRVNLQSFRPTPSDFRKTHGIGEKFMVLGVCSAWTDRKGLSDYVALSQRLPEDTQLVLVGLTPEQQKKMPGSILALGRTASPRELAEIYSAADVFLNLTYEDNYPTVNLEARACGCTVVCYNTCGCPETLGENDLLVKPGDLDAVCAALQEVRRKRDENL